MLRVIQIVLVFLGFALLGPTPVALADPLPEGCAGLAGTYACTGDARPPDGAYVATTYAVVGVNPVGPTLLFPWDTQPVSIVMPVTVCPFVLPCIPSGTQVELVPSMHVPGVDNPAGATPGVVQPLFYVTVYVNEIVSAGPTFGSTCVDMNDFHPGNKEPARTISPTHVCVVS